MDEERYSIIQTYPLPSLSHSCVAQDLVHLSQSPSTPVDRVDSERFTARYEGAHNYRKKGSRSRRIIIMEASHPPFVSLNLYLSLAVSRQILSRLREDHDFHCSIVALSTHNSWSVTRRQADGTVILGMIVIQGPGDLM